MNLKKASVKSSRRRRRRLLELSRRKNKTLFFEAIQWLVTRAELFSKIKLHGNIKWDPAELAIQTLIWSWQEARNVTDAFNHTLEICEDLGLKQTAKTYTAFMNALGRYSKDFVPVMREQHQMLVEEVGGRSFRTNGWVLMAFDGSRITAPRSIANEQALCAPNYGNGKRAKYGKKKSKGLRRKRNEKNKPNPQAPQAWITMLWHMELRLPWTWRLGPSNSSERDHVKQILAEEEFPKNTLFCGDAGFTGYPLWNTIVADANQEFLIRVGANVNLLSEHAGVKRLGDGLVLCWPKGRMDSGDPPLRLRLVRVKIGKTKMWMLTSILDQKKLTHKQIVRYYKMRWGIEVEFRGLKQTVDKHKLRCRNSQRLLVELDWSIRGMAAAELLALREQLPSNQDKSDDSAAQDRSFAQAMRALRNCMRNLHKYSKPDEGLFDQLANATIQRYANTTDKRARYRPKNPDKKALGEPNVRKLNPEERERLRKQTENIAA